MVAYKTIVNKVLQDADIIHSIREQSEAVYAVLHYLTYEKRQGRQHKECRPHHQLCQEQPLQ